ncbi:MAG: beta strand repeat-containing protein, partial [Acidimicrobiales bacterium]
CDLNDECVLYIGDDYTNFTAPHYFSPLFYVNPNGGVDSGVNPGDGTGLSSSLTLTKSTSSTGYTAAGQVIPYNYLVDNTGNNAVTGLTVTDNKIPTVNCPSSSLAAGADETCTASYTTTAADVAAGSVTNIATANATDSGGNPVSSASSQVTVSIPSTQGYVPGAAAPVSPFTANTPFSSGQNINVVIPANSTLPPNANVDIVECSAPNGVIPTDPSQCDGETIQGASIHPQSNGAINLHTQTHSYFTLYALPDFATLGETSGPACSLTTECILYVGDNNNDLTQPHVWSQPFYINPNAGVDSGANPGDGSALAESLTLAKSTTSTGYGAAGQTIPYSYLVTNTGNATLTGISVADNKNTVSCPTSTLNPGANETCTGTYTITTADMTAGSVTNVATASATGPEPVSSASSQVTITTSGPADGSVISGAAATVGTVTSGAPFSSGQNINVVIPANTDLPHNANVNIVECSAPNGVVPTSPSACDGETIQGASIHPNTDGSVNLQSETHSLYTLFALPDFATLGETSGPACSLTTECILYIGDNQNDFTQPHYWSAPFYINPNGGVDNGANPGTGGSGCVTPVITSGASATATENTPFSFTVTTCSATVPKISASGFPKGITVTDNHNGTATIAGTITAYSGVDSTAVLSAAIVGHSTTQDFTLTVDEAAAFTNRTTDLVHTGTAFSYPVTTEHGYPAPAITTPSALPAGVTLTDGPDGSATLGGTPGPSAGGVYPITLVATNGVGAPVDQSFTLTVYQTPTLSAPAAVTVTEGQTMTPVTVAIAGFPTPVLKPSGLPKGVTLTNNGDGTATIAGIPVYKAHGVYDATIDASSKAGTGTTSIAFTVDSLATFNSKAPALAHTGVAITPLTVSTVYGYPEPAISTSSTLPAGITLTDNGNGTATLAGTPGPSAGGSYPITIDATNSTGTTTQTFTWIVDQAAQITSPDSATANAGSAMTPFTVTTTAYPQASLKASGLPKGVALVDNHDGTGTISGTPTTAGTYTATITAGSKGGNGTQTFTLTVG